MENKLDMLFKIAEDNNIIIEYVDFPDNIQGLYYKEDGCPPIIGINENITSNSRLFTCVLAEELGHHFTTVGDTTAEYYSYADRLIVNKKETLALKWASDLLLPLDEIVQAVKDSILQFSEMAEHLQVTESFLCKRFEFLSRQQSYVKIDDCTSLLLTSLPSVYVLKHFDA